MVAIHDGVRPFVTRAMIEDTIHSAVRVGAVVLAMPVKDTIKVSNPDGTVLKTLDRESLWQIQTPQTFRVICDQRGLLSGGRRWVCWNG